MTYEEARAQFPVLDSRAYLNAGTNGPLARATVDAFVAQAQRDLEEGRTGPKYFEQMLELRETARQAFAAVLGVESDRMALVESTSRGCATVLAGLGLTGEDEVVTTDHEHFGLTGPLYATGARVVIVDADEAALLAAITPRTRLIATSHVLWTTGRRLDVQRVKGESGLPLLVDGAQSAGAIPVDVGELDFYTVSAQKWLCAPDPAGALYVRDPATVRVKTPSYFAQDSYELLGRLRSESDVCSLRRRVGRRSRTRRPRRGARRASGVALRARGGDGGALPRAARAARRDRDAAGPLDARLVPAAGRPRRARRAAV